jgi:hypothetical protein
MTPIYSRPKEFAKKFAKGFVAPFKAVAKMTKGGRRSHGNGNGKKKIQPVRNKKK